MLHHVYWAVGGPALRALGPGAVFRASPALARPARRFGSPGVAAGVRTAFPDAEPAFVDRIVGEDAQRRARTAVERLVLGRLDRAALDRWVDVSGAGLLRSGPAVVVQAHVGVHGLPGVALALHGVPLTIHGVMVPDADLSGGRGYSQRRRRELEATFPVSYLYAVGPGSSDRCRAVLDQGRVLLGVPDGATSLTLLPGRHRVLPLFGLPVRWPSFAFDLAEQAGVPICGLFTDSSGDRHEIEVVPLDGDDPQRDFVGRYDAFVRQHPGQWQFWDRLVPGELLAGEASRRGGRSG